MATTTPVPPADTASYEDTAGSGWADFAALLLAIGGVMRFFDALWSFRYHGALPANLENALFGTSLKTYGWIYLGLTVVLLASAYAVSKDRSQVGRWVGVVAGGVAAITAMPWMPYYPVWSLVYIALGGTVVYALVAHGGRPGAAKGRH